MSDLFGNHIVGFPTRWLKLSCPRRHSTWKFIYGLMRGGIRKENTKIITKIYNFETITQFKKCKNLKV